MRTPRSELLQLGVGYRGQPSRLRVSIPREELSDPLYRRTAEKLGIKDFNSDNDIEQVLDFLSGGGNTERKVEETTSSEASPPPSSSSGGNSFGYSGSYDVDPQQLAAAQILGIGKIDSDNDLAQITNYLEQGKSRQPALSIEGTNARLMGQTMGVRMAKSTADKTGARRLGSSRFTSRFYKQGRADKYVNTPQYNNSLRI